MWKIAGFYYDLQKGFLKAVELGDKLSQEFGPDLEQAVLVDKEKDLVENEKRGLEWEEKNVVAQVKWEGKLAKDKKVRNIIGAASICGLAAYPFVLIFSEWLIGIDEFPPIPFLDLLYLFSLLLTSFLRLALPLLFVGGSISYVIMLLSHISNRKRSLTLVPKPKLISRYYEVPSIYFDLEIWWRAQLGLDVRLPRTGNDYGVPGEERLVQCLSVVLPDEYLCMAGVLVDMNLDADVILIGPAGIWVLESKYYSGNIILKNGEWYRHKTFYEQGGYQTSKEEYLEDFAKQWQREKQAVVNILKNDGFLNDVDGLVKGGLVFTHPECTLSIDKSSPVEIGDIGYWCQFISGEMDKNLLSEKQIMKIADSLLMYSKKLNKDETMSAVEFANMLYKKAKLSIVMYIEKHKPSLEE